MRRDRHGATLLAVLALVLSACDGGSSEATSSTPLPETSSTTAATGAPETGVSTTTTTAPLETTTSSTTMPLGGAPLLAAEGDRNETVEAVQFLLNCSGAEIAVDGVYGPGTRGAVETAQERLGVTVDGVAGDETITALSRACTEPRHLEGDSSVVGNTAPGDPGLYTIALLSGTTLRVTVADADLVLTLTDPEGFEVPTGTPRVWTVEDGGEYRLEVAALDSPTNFSLGIEVISPEPEVGDWVLATDGITYGEAELAIGDNAQSVIDQVFDFLGHGVRGAYDEFDTGWYTITDPGSLGLRGVFIEGLAFLFFGPHPEDPDRSETLVRIRYEGPGHDADGEPRPEGYVTTAEGITVGDTLAELTAAYGDGVSAGSNSEEFYYRLADSGGELCFYFDTEDEPSNSSTISEIATECRTG